MSVKCNTRKCKRNVGMGLCGLKDIQISDAVCQDCDYWEVENITEIMKEHNPQCDRAKHKYISKRQDGILMK